LSKKYPDGKLSQRPLTVKAALRWCKEVHRRLPSLQGGMWCIAGQREGSVVGVAIVGRPTARMLDNGERLQVLRVASLETDISPSGHKGLNSMLYGACARAAFAMGATDLWTYIHDDEPGTSLKAAGWIKDPTPTDGGEWSRPSRARAKTVEAGRKIRWFAPWSVMAQPIIGGAFPQRHPPQRKATEHDLETSKTEFHPRGRRRPERAAR
jgi:hypothetical protein